MIWLIALWTLLVWWHGYTLGRDHGCRRHRALWLATRRATQDEDRRDSEL